MDTRQDAGEWVELLDRFTERNAGRRSRLELDYAEFGAQWQEIDLPLRGVAYDRRLGSVEIMIGEAGPRFEHLTHTISNPERIEVRSAPDGRDEALCVAHEGGQTLLQILV